jgi:hypothetical protein
MFGKLVVLTALAALTTDHGELRHLGLIKFLTLKL